MSWNVVLNKFCEIKEKVLKAGYPLWDYDQEKESCVEYWVRMLKDETYDSLIKGLSFNEENGLLLIRYKEYGHLFKESDEFSFDSFWDFL